MFTPTINRMIHTGFAMGGAVLNRHGSTKPVETTASKVTRLAQDLVRLQREDDSCMVTESDLRAAGWSQRDINNHIKAAIAQANTILAEAAPRTIVKDAEDIPLDWGKISAPARLDKASHASRPIPSGIAMLLGSIASQSEAITLTGAHIKTALSKSDCSLNNIDKLTAQIRHEADAFAALTSVTAKHIAALKARHPVREGC